MESREISFEKSREKPLQFDKVLITAGAKMHRLQQNYSNVYKIEDAESHAKAFNSSLSAS